MVSIGIVDVETTGFSPKADRIVEVAALLVTPEGEVTDTFTTLVNPQRHVSATEIHGLTATVEDRLNLTQGDRLNLTRP